MSAKLRGFLRGRCPMHRWLAFLPSIPQPPSPRRGWCKPLVPPATAPAGASRATGPGISSPTKMCCRWPPTSGLWSRSVNVFPGFFVLLQISFFFEVWQGYMGSPSALRMVVGGPDPPPPWEVRWCGGSGPPPPSAGPKIGEKFSLALHAGK